MQYTKPDYYDSFLCGGEACPQRCAAPADMTWMQLHGSHGEMGLSMACNSAAETILLRKGETVYKTIRDQSTGGTLSDLSEEQLSLMQDAEKTLDIILANRAMELRSNVMLALTYATEFDPMIGSELRYAYDELDWGYTEQPWKQLSSVTPMQGYWAEKRSDLLEILKDYLEAAGADAVLSEQLRGTIGLFDGLSTEEYRALRDNMETYLKPMSYMQEHLMEYLLHRYYYRDCESQTILPAVRFIFASYAVISAMAARIFRETGEITEQAFVRLCSGFSRCFEEDGQRRDGLFEKMAAAPVYHKERLQRMLWK